jgi:hypothetical protein
LAECGKIFLFMGLTALVDSAKMLFMTTAAAKPRLKLTGNDGNAFSIISRARRALKDANYTEEQIEQFSTEATSGDYDHVLQTCFKWFDVR